MPRESMTKMIDGELALEEYYFAEERAKEIKVLISKEQVQTRDGVGEPLLAINF